MRATTIIAWLFVLTMPLAAAGQQAPADAKSDQKAGSDTDSSAAPPDQTPGSQGPMTLERVHNGFALAPDFKVTKFGSSSSAGRLAGGYGGWILDDTILIGGGGYWLTNDTSAVRDFGYGGAVVEWLQRGDRTIGYAARGLVGFGTARLADEVLTIPIERVTDRDGRHVFVPQQIVERFRRRTDFFVAEPQADVLFTLTGHLRIDAGVGYRLIAGSRADSQLRGVTGSISLQVGELSARR